MKIGCFPHRFACIWDSSQSHVQHLTASYMSTLQIHLIRTWITVGDGWWGVYRDGKVDVMKIYPPTYKRDNSSDVNARLHITSFATQRGGMWGVAFCEFDGVTVGIWQNWGHIYNAVCKKKKKDKPSNFKSVTIFVTSFTACQRRVLNSSFLSILAAAVSVPAMEIFFHKEPFLNIMQ